MSEYTANRQNDPNVVEIDLLELAGDLLHGLRHLWWVVVALTVLGALVMFFRSTVVYSPRYMAETTVSVRSVNSGAYYDDSAATAEQLGKTFPYILTSGVLQDIVAEELGVKSMPGSINVTNIEGTNLLTIQVSASDGETAYNILQLFIQNYPSVAQYVVGQTELTVIEDSGIPGNSGKTSVLRGSVKMGALVGALLGMLIVLGYVMTFRTVRTSSDLKNMVSVPYLGTLPVYRKKQRRHSDYTGVNILEDNPQDDYVESMNLIRTRLERHMEARGVKSIMVTSAIPGEGKSTVAANLAASFARKGKRVFLIDCDLRNPTTQKVFNIPGEFPGLREVLAGHASIAEAFYKMPQKDAELFCLFGASHGSENIEILGSKEMGSLLTSLEEVADVLILDTPPSAMLVDASILVRHVKSALFVVQSDYARRQYIQRGMEELSEMGVEIVGCVLNGGKESSADRNS